MKKIFLLSLLAFLFAACGEETKIEKMKSCLANNDFVAAAKAIDGGNFTEEQVNQIVYVCIDGYKTTEPLHALAKSSKINANYFFSQKTMLFYSLEYDDKDFFDLLLAGNDEPLKQCGTIITESLKYKTDYYFEKLYELQCVKDEVAQNPKKYLFDLFMERRAEITNKVFQDEAFYNSAIKTEHCLLGMICHFSDENFSDLVSKLKKENLPFEKCPRALLEAVDCGDVDCILWLMENGYSPYDKVDLIGDGAYMDTFEYIDWKLKLLRMSQFQSGETASDKEYRQDLEKVLNFLLSYKKID